MASLGGAAGVGADCRSRLAFSTKGSKVFPGASVFGFPSQAASPSHSAPAMAMANVLLRDAVDFMVSSMGWVLPAPKKTQPCVQGRADRFGGGAAGCDTAAVRRRRPELPDA